MKFLLVLCLLALISCDVVESLKCLVSQPKVQELVLKVLNLVLNKEYDQLLPLLLANLGVLVEAVKVCFS